MKIPFKISPCISFKEIEKANWYDSISETYRFRFRCRFFKFL